MYYNISKAQENPPGVQHANHSATEPPPRDSNSMYFGGGVHTYADNIDDTLGKNSFDS